MLFAVIATIVLGILILGHIAVYAFILSVFPIFATGTIFILKILTVLLPVAFVGSLLLADLYTNNRFTRVFYRTMAIWLCFFFYMLMAAVVYAVVVHFSPSEWIGMSLLVISVIVTLYGLFHAQDIKVKHISVTMPNLSEEWQSRKIVFMSDLHLGQINGKRFAKHIMNLVKRENPDLLLIGGDVYDGVKMDERDIIESLGEVKPKEGIYFVMGNHEEFNDNLKYRKALQEKGIVVLEDKMITIDGLQIIGIDYKTTLTKQSFERVLDEIVFDPESPSIMMKHTPMHLEVAAKKGIDLGLFGHTHRAQAFPLNFITHMVFKGYDYGLRKFDDMMVYTSSGVGTWGPPMRVGSDAEIIVISFS